MKPNWDEAPIEATHWCEAKNQWRDQTEESIGDCCIRIPDGQPAVPEWDGEGLPPVGCECEVKCAGYWVRAKVVHVTAIGSVVCEMTDEFRGKVRVNHNQDYFRPLRTREQRERDELAEFLGQCVEMRKTFGQMAEEIIAAGWRKGE